MEKNRHAASESNAPLQQNSGFPNVERVQDADAGLQKVMAVEEEVEYSEAMATVLRRSRRRRERSRAKAMRSSLLLEMRLTPLSVTKESERERETARERATERGTLWRRWRREEEGFRNFKP